jgi:hypothetical protein
MPAELTNVEKLVYGADAVRGDDGQVIQMGVGSKARETAQHLAALEKSRAKASEIPSSTQLQEALRLVQASTNAKANEALVQKLTAAADDARQTIAAADAASRESDKKRLAHLQLMADERSKFNSEIEHDRAALNAERERRLADLDAREADIAKRESELRAASAQLAERLGEVDKKLQAIREVAR